MPKVLFGSFLVLSILSLLLFKSPDLFTSNTNHSVVYAQESGDSGDPLDPNCTCYDPDYVPPDDRGGLGEGNEIPADSVIETESPPDPGSTFRTDTEGRPVWSPPGDGQQFYVTVPGGPGQCENCGDNGGGGDGGGDGGGGGGGPPPPPGGSSAAGIILANPNPCSIPNGSTTCTSHFSWSSSNTSNTTLHVHPVGQGNCTGATLYNSTSGAVDISGIIDSTGYDFDLCGNSDSVFLDRVFVRGVAAPNLFVSSITPPIYIIAGHNDNIFAATVSNNGSAASPSTITRFYIDNILIFNLNTAGIAAGGNQNLSTSGWTATLGDHALVVCADADGANNCSAPIGFSVYGPLIVSCTPSSATVPPNTVMSWIASVSGGNPFSSVYTWGLDASGNTASVPANYPTIGTKQARVNVNDGGQSTTSSICSVTINTTPFVQTQGGDVHSNTRINVPGGQ